MEPLLKQLRELPSKFAALSAGARWGVIGAAAAVIIGIVAVMVVSESGTYQYAFTNLTPEDSSEAAGVLKGSGIPFRSEAGGSALSVPANKVHEVRLLLATAGLPRGGGIGFEIFDRGDLGVSEFTQKVNLRRATEGELARTIGRLSPVRSARVHITLPEKGLYRNEDRKAAAAVVLNLQPGRTLDERELSGVRHLVSASVAGLSPESVTIVDGRGGVLAGDRSDGAKAITEQREMETGLEHRIVALLEPVVGRGSVVAKVTAAVDNSEVESTEDAYDAENPAIRSERKVTEQVMSDQAASGGVAGAAANQPLSGTPGPSAGGGNRNQTQREDTLKNYEVTKKTTRQLSRTPRLLRLSAAVLISGQDGKPRPEAELRRLGELAKHAVGFDEKRGDKLDISSAAFAVDNADAEAALPLWKQPAALKLGAAGLVGLLLLMGAAGFLLRSKRAPAADVRLLRPGSKVSDIEAAVDPIALAAANAARKAAGLPPLTPSSAEEIAAGAGQSTDSAADQRKHDAIVRARELAEADPQRAAHLLRAWITFDAEKEQARNA
jgi:flagellar M-ring protein FliF